MSLIVQKIQYLTEVLVTWLLVTHSLRFESEARLIRILSKGRRKGRKSKIAKDKKGTTSEE